MEIKDRIKNIGQYFKGMKVEDIDGEQVVYVIVSFPSNWYIDESIPNKFNVSIAPGNNGEYYFCASIDVGFEAVFDAIDFNIKKMITALERANLLKTKVEELKKLFQEEDISLESLKTLEFTYKGKKKDKKVLVPTIPQTIENKDENDNKNE